MVLTLEKKQVERNQKPVRLDFSGRKKQLSRSQIEAKLFLKRIVNQNEDIGAASTLTTGSPGSAKTAVDCYISQRLMNEHPNSKIFWRSALNAPLQIFKLSNWHIYIQKGSGIRLFNRHSNRDVTDKMQKKNEVTFFSTFDELYDISKPAVCNGVFFRDLYLPGIFKDQGNLQWFRWLRYLLNREPWNYVFLDEYQEACKPNSGGPMFWEIAYHADDVSTARKACIGVHVNCHQLNEVDFRPRDCFMLMNQMYGSKHVRSSPVSRQAIASLRRPTHEHGAEGWLSEGGNYGLVTFRDVYILPPGKNIVARIVESYEDVKKCRYCNRKYVADYRSQVYCSERCSIQGRKLLKPSKSRQKPSIQGENSI